MRLTNHKGTKDGYHLIYSPPGSRKTFVYAWRTTMVAFKKRNPFLFLIITTQKLKDKLRKARSLLQES